MRLTAFRQPHSFSRRYRPPCASIHLSTPANTNSPSAAQSQSSTSDDTTTACRTSRRNCLAAHHRNRYRDALAGLIKWLESSQWLKADELERNAFRQLAITARHCERESPFFAERLKKAGLTASDLARPEGLVGSAAHDAARHPTGGRRAFLPQCSCIASPDPRRAHVGFDRRATGRQIAHRSTLTMVIANTMRDHAWHERDFTAPADQHPRQSQNGRSRAQTGALR